MTAGYDAIWGNGAAYRRQFDVGAYMPRFEKWNETDRFAQLRARPHETQLLSSMIASSSAYQQTRVQTSLQLASPGLVAADSSLSSRGRCCCSAGSASFPSLERHERSRALLWLIRHRERDFPDPGAEPALYGALAQSRPHRWSRPSRRSERRRNELGPRVASPQRPPSRLAIVPRAAATGSTGRGTGRAVPRRVRPVPVHTDRNSHTSPPRRRRASALPPAAQ